MKAILTKYIGPTNTRPSRIKASDCDGNSVTISYPHELSGEAAFRKAADALCLWMGWKGPLVGGGLKNDWVFCFADGCPEVLAIKDSAHVLAGLWVPEDVDPELAIGCAETDEFTLKRDSVRSARTALQPFTR